MSHDEDETSLVPTPSSLVRLSPEERAEEFTRHARAAQEFESAAVAKNTLVAYQRAWNRFSAWVFARELEDLPASPGTVLAYVMAAVEDGIPNLDGSQGKPLSLPSVQLHMAAITFVHRQKGHDDPCAQLPKNVIQGLKRKLGKPPKQKQWLSTEQVLHAATLFPEDLRGQRDKAILLIGFLAGGRRRSEVASMRVEDLQVQPDGSFLWTLPRSKTDQEGHGFSIPIPVLPDEAKCPTAALKRWLLAGDIFEGPVFRSISRYETLGTTPVQPALVAEVVKRAVKLLGLDPEEYAGHSLRAGFVTSLSRDGVQLEEIMDLTGHKSFEVARQYKRVGDHLADNAVKRALLKSARED